jgi:hypothetical protein
MGRDLSYAYIPNKLNNKYTKEELQQKIDNCEEIYEMLEWEDPCEYRNCVELMSNKLFSFNELKDYARKCLDENNFKALEPISKILKDMADGEYVVITSL